MVGSGEHYEKTANAWLANLDAKRAQVLQYLRSPRAEHAAVVAALAHVLHACASVGLSRRPGMVRVHYLFERQSDSEPQRVFNLFNFAAYQLAGSP